MSRCHGKAAPSSQRLCRVAVAGAFSSGKSAFINHLLGGQYAKEDVTPTTRACTEYAYGGKTSYEILDVSGAVREVESQWFLDESCREGCESRFRVTLPNEFLRQNRIVIVDTSGYSANDADNAAARRAIENADAVVWLVNVPGEGATLKGNARRFLYETTQSREIPVLLVITQIDCMNPPTMSHSASDVLEGWVDALVKETKDVGRPIRLVHRPICVTTRPESVLPSLRRRVANQRGDIADALHVCLDSARAVRCARAQKKRRELAAERRKKIRMLEREIADYRECRDKHIEKLAAVFKESLTNFIKEHLEQLASDEDRISRCVITNVWRSNWFFDDYRAEFCPDADLFKTESSKEEQKQLLKQFVSNPYRSLSTAYNALVKSLNRVHSVTDDSCWGNAKDNAYSGMINRVARKIENELDELAECFVRAVLEECGQLLSDSCVKEYNQSIRDKTQELENLKKDNDYEE